MLLEKLKSFKSSVIASITINVLWAVFIILICLSVTTPHLALLFIVLFIICTIVSYIIAIVNGVKSLEFQRYLPFNTPAYSDAGTIKIIGIISIILGGRILDIILLVLTKRLIQEIRNNSVYTTDNGSFPTPQQTYPNYPGERPMQ